MEKERQALNSKVQKIHDQTSFHLNPTDTGSQFWTLPEDPPKGQDCQDAIHHLPSVTGSGDLLEDISSLVLLV